MSRYTQLRCALERSDPDGGLPPLSAWPNRFEPLKKPPVRGTIVIKEASAPTTNLGARGAELLDRQDMMASNLFFRSEPVIPQPAAAAPLRWNRQTLRIPVTYSSGAELCRTT